MADLRAEFRIDGSSAINTLEDVQERAQRVARDISRPVEIEFEVDTSSFRGVSRRLRNAFRDLTINFDGAEVDVFGSAVGQVIRSANRLEQGLQEINDQNLDDINKEVLFLRNRIRETADDLNEFGRNLKDGDELALSVDNALNQLASANRRVDEVQKNIEESTSLNVDTSSAQSGIRLLASRLSQRLSSAIGDIPWASLGRTAGRRFSRTFSNRFRRAFSGGLFGGGLGVGGLLGIGAGFAAFDQIGNAVEAAADLDEGIRNIASLDAFPDADDGLARIEAILDSSFENTGFSQLQFLEPLYRTISAGNIPLGNTVDFLERASNLRVAGNLQDIDSAVRALNVGFINFGRTLSTDVDESFQLVSDGILSTVQQFDTTADVFTTAFSTVAPEARALGFSLEETNSALGTLITARAGDGATAATNLRQFFTELNRTDSEVAEAFADATGGQTVRDFAADGGTIVEVLEILDEQAQSAGLSIAELFGNVRSAQGALILLNDIERLERETNEQRLSLFLPRAGDFIDEQILQNQQLQDAFREREGVFIQADDNLSEVINGLGGQEQFLDFFEVDEALLTNQLEGSSLTIRDTIVENLSLTDIVNDAIGGDEVTAQEVFGDIVQGAFDVDTGITGGNIDIDGAILTGVNPSEIIQNLSDAAGFRDQTLIEFLEEIVGPNGDGGLLIDYVRQLEEAGEAQNNFTNAETALLNIGELGDTAFDSDAIRDAATVTQEAFDIQIQTFRNSREQLDAQLDQLRLSFGGAFLAPLATLVPQIQEAVAALLPSIDMLAFGLSEGLSGIDFGEIVQPIIDAFEAIDSENLGRDLGGLAGSIAGLVGEFIGLVINLAPSITSLITSFTTLASTIVSGSVPILVEVFRSLEESLGELFNDPNFADNILRLVDAVGDLAITAIPALVDIFEIFSMNSPELFEILIPLIEDLLNPENVSEFLEVLETGLSITIGAVRVLGALLDGIGGVVRPIFGIFSELGLVLGSIFRSIFNQFRGAFDIIRGIITLNGDLILDGFQRLGGSILNIWIAVFESFVNFLGDIINVASGTINFFSGIFNALAPESLELPEIPDINDLRLGRFGRNEAGFGFDDSFNAVINAENQALAEQGVQLDRLSTNYSNYSDAVKLALVTQEPFLAAVGNTSELLSGQAGSSGLDSLFEGFVIDQSTIDAVQRVRDLQGGSLDISTEVGQAALRLQGAANSGDIDEITESAIALEEAITNLQEANGGFVPIEGGTGTALTSNVEDITSLVDQLTAEAGTSLGLDLEELEELRQQFIEACGADPNVILSADLSQVEEATRSAQELFLEDVCGQVGINTTGINDFVAVNPDNFDSLSEELQANYDRAFASITAPIDNQLDLAPTVDNSELLEYRRQLLELDEFVIDPDVEIDREFINSEIANLEALIRGIRPEVEVQLNVDRSPLNNLLGPIEGLLPNAVNSAFGRVTRTPQLSWLSEFGHPEAVVSSLVSPERNFGYLSSAGLADELAPVFAANYGSPGGTGAMVVAEPTNITVNVQSDPSRSQADDLILGGRIGNTTADAVVNARRQRRRSR